MSSLILNSVSSIIDTVDKKIRHASPYKVIFVSVSTTIAIPIIYNTWNQPWAHYVFNTSWKDFNWKKEVGGVGLNVALRIPLLKGVIEKTIQNEVDSYGEQFLEERDDVLREEDREFKPLNKKGMSPEEILKDVPMLAEGKEVDLSRVSGVCYGPEVEEELDQFRKEFLIPYGKTNVLHSSMFPDIGKMERDVVYWVGNLLHLEKPFGCVTSGGTESLLLACKSAVNLGKKRGIKKPNIVMPYSGHSAVNKAAEYFNFEVLYVPLDEDGEVSLPAFERAINKNTVLLFASFSNYPYGTIDDIEAIGALALKHEKLFHVDACLGGFVAGWLQGDQESGIPIFDFRIPGVTSISMDLHKYVYALKGSSVVIHRHQEVFEEAIFTDGLWPGGTNVTQRMSGSRSGMPTADSWATMQYYGEDGYVEYARNIAYATRTLAARCKGALNSVIEVVGNPKINTVAFRSTAEYPETAVWQVLSLMCYGIDGELINGHSSHFSIQQYPPGGHFSITRRHANSFEEAKRFVDEMVEDLAIATAYVAKNPTVPIQGLARSYGGVVDYPPYLINRVLSRYGSIQTSPKL